MELAPPARVGIRELTTGLHRLKESAPAGRRGQNHAGVRTVAVRSVACSHHRPLADLRQTYQPPACHAFLFLKKESSRPHLPVLTLGGLYLWLLHQTSSRSGHRLEGGKNTSEPVRTTLSVPRTV